jgi:hypothetical protein
MTTADMEPQTFEIDEDENWMVNFIFGLNYWGFLTFGVLLSLLSFSIMLM